MAGATDFVVRRDDLHDCRVTDGPVPEVAPGQALLEVSAFGLTSNNITYAVFGEAMSYWDFFPADEGWGRVPVWGFAEVAASPDEGLEEGARVFGYLPPSTHLVVTPERMSGHGFTDASPHRAALPAAYNAYTRVAADPSHRPEREDQQMLLRPLFFTSFLLDDFLADSGLFGAETVVISSASSKTAHGTAFLLAQRENVQVIGLTSSRSTAFAEGLGVFDRVVGYDEVPALPRDSAVYVDVAGDPDTRRAVHEHYGELLRHSAVVGATHHDRVGADSDPPPGTSPTFFFAPDRVRTRGDDWGRDGLERRLAQAWEPYVEWTDGWLAVKHERGAEALQRTYLDLLDGRIDPATGHVLSLR